MLMAEFLTAVRHNLPIKIFINNNGAYGQILWEQMVLGFPEFGVRHRSFADYAPWAVACGAHGVKVTDPAMVDDAVREALAHPGPALVDCNVNPDEPPMPGKISYAQAKGFTEAFLRGQPHKGGIVKTVVEDTIERLRS
jgi:pyruvate dehydrogenase (quinone)